MMSNFCSSLVLAVVGLQGVGGVRHLNNVSHAAAPARGPCSLMGGLVSADISATCCFSTNVVTQRTLHTYGLAYPCLSSWTCEKDGVTPTPEFEHRAVGQLCQEAGCADAVVTAMKSNWMTSKGSSAMSEICKSPDKAKADGAAVMANFRGLPQQALAMHVGKGNKTVKGNKTDQELADEKECKEKNCKTDKQRDEFCKAEDEKAKKDTKGKKSNCYDVCCTKADLICFPGDALVRTQERGDVAVAHLREGERVLAQGASGELEFTDVLGFIHARSMIGGAYVELVHEQGRLRVSHNHLVFVVGSSGAREDKPAGEVQVGDRLYAVAGEAVAASAVLEVLRRSDAKGMYAPLTSSGTIVVDGVVASNYAFPGAGLRLPHWLGHVALAPVRAYHQLGLAKLTEVLGTSEIGEKQAEYYHPYVAMIFRSLKLHTLLSLR